ncbi:glycosyltransferase [Marinihelvus fidelis]|uniref:Glycosyltransferase n=1 Tax=Marinihelvus fidelis TaxID=2613842 RepID=A0A5N0TGF1_9GAMM|nr:CmcI family methyltransferase [Marinihelvus fidelis]KAA9133548.1 glycosyltransferase [Marinihelvus fidelis]
MSDPGNPAISVVVIAYEMNRELPRTLRTLSPGYQRGIEAGEYEVIVVDNGSHQPVTAADCPFDTTNMRFLDQDAGGVSPVAAIHQGLDTARGDLVGVMIDGARMASPGLLRHARDAAKIRPNPVIGTLAFHLGDDVQMQSCQRGYNQRAEDRLLATVPWVDDGYRLFDISVFAGSSSRGWFHLPSESNALFMPKRLWAELGGYDRGFRSVGGGLANLDTWKRAVELPHTDVIMLLGEGTFHQFHGGVATNSPPGTMSQVFHEEYRSIRGEQFITPANPDVSYVGTVPTNARRLLVDSALSLLPNRGQGRDHEAGALTARERPFTSPMPPRLAEGLLGGVMKSRYRDVLMHKSPLDLGIYLQLFSRIRPRSLVEIGGKHGGSALLFADLLGAMHDDDYRVISIDNHPRQEFSDRRIDFLRGDALDLATSLSADVLQALPRPLVVIEDSAHTYETSLAVMEFFHPHLRPGDYIIVEDGVVSQLPASRFRAYDHGPNRAVREFLALQGDHYEIDTELCDFYGYNMTFNPNGYLRRS